MEILGFCFGIMGLIALVRVDKLIKPLKQKGVLTVHGSGFAEKYGSCHFRIVYLPKMEILESAMNKIEDFVR